MSEQLLRKLIFVYNANSGKRNALLDSMHKILNPSTYDCNLCDITYGLFSEKVDWKTFRESYSIEMEFLHRDEFEKDYASKFTFPMTYPIVLGAALNEFEIVIGTNELNQLGNSQELIELIQKRVPVN